MNQQNQKLVFYQNKFGTHFLVRPTKRKSGEFELLKSGTVRT